MTPTDDLDPDLGRAAPPPGEDAGPGEWGPTGWNATAAARAGRHPAVRVVVLGLGGLLTFTLLAGSSWAAANVLVRTTERDSATLEGTVVRAVVDVDGTADVRIGEDGRAHIERRSTFGLSRPEITRTLVDGVLTVRATCTDVPGICANDLTIEVPATADVAVTADRATVTGFDGRVEASSNGGAVELVDLGGPIDTRAGGGSVTGTRLRSAQVRASVGAGAIDLTFVAPPTDVEATAGAGSVVVVVPPGDEAYRVDATSGAGSREVTVMTDPTSSRRIRASTGAGAVEVRYGRG